MIGTLYSFHFRDGRVVTHRALHDPHARQIAKALPNVVRITEDDGRHVWRAGER